MSATGLRDPLIRTYLALGVVLLPVIVLLAEAYPGYEERMRAVGASLQVKPLPTVAQMQAQLVGDLPSVGGLNWRLAYAAAKEPRTGIVQVYDLLDSVAVRYRFVVIRHDIACGVCRDLLAGMLADAAQGTWVHMVLFEPFERKGAVVADATSFLRQFTGTPVGQRHVLGEDLDGLTAATNSVKGFVLRAQEAGQWLTAHPPGEGASARGEP